MGQNYCVIYCVEKYLRRLVTPGGLPHRHPYYSTKPIVVQHFANLDIITNSLLCLFLYEDSNPMQPEHHRIFIGNSITVVSAEFAKSFDQKSPLAL
jgi:hypothetical protein